MIDLSKITPEELNFILAVTSVSVFFSLYWFLTHSEKFMDTMGSDSSSSEWNIRRLSGFVTLGVIPAILMTSLTSLSLQDLGLNSKWHPTTWIWLLIFGALITIGNLLIAGTKSNLAQYPQIRNSTWTARTRFEEFGGWLIYLVGYEFLFRGILLFATAPLIGAVPAIALNVALYSVVHMVKGGSETFGSILLGLALAYFTLLSGSIWFALIIHVYQAWINSILSFRKHPDMKYGK